MKYKSVRSMKIDTLPVLRVRRMHYSGLIIMNKIRSCRSIASLFCVQTNSNNQADLHGRTTLFFVNSIFVSTQSDLSQTYFAHFCLLISVLRYFVKQSQWRRVHV